MQLQIDAVGTAVPGRRHSVHGSRFGLDPVVVDASLVARFPFGRERRHPFDPLSITSNVSGRQRESHLGSETRGSTLSRPSSSAESSRRSRKKVQRRGSQIRYAAGMVRRDEDESARREAARTGFTLRFSSGCKSRPGKRRSAG